MLIVDDEPALLDVMAIVLADAGYTLLKAGGGDVALARLRSHDVDLVLCDVMMPRMGGPELMKAARQEGRTVPFVFVSSLPERGVRGLVGAHAAYLAKPFSLEGLLAAVVKHVPPTT